MTQDAVNRYFSEVGPLRAETEEAAQLDDAAYLKAIGRRIGEARRRLGMSRPVLAGQAGVSGRYLTMVEGGKCNVSILVLRALGRALGIAPVELIDSEFAAALGRLAGGLGPGELEAAHGLLARHFSARGKVERQGRILLVGMQGAGKHALGTRLAQERGVPFIDLDAAIASAPGSRASVRGFGLLEQRAIERVIAEHEAAVITAWAALSATPRSFSQLQRHCRMIWLRATPEELLRRAGITPTLGKAAAKRALGDLAAIIAAHEPMLTRADHVLDTTGLSIPACLDRLRAIADAG